MENKGTNKEKLGKLKGLLSMDMKDLKGIFSKGEMKTKNKHAKKSEKKKVVVAFDIGTTFIKIAVGTYYKDELSISKYIQVPAPAGSIEDGVIKNRNALVTTLKDVLKENDIKAKDGICTTNSTTIINREILIPVVSQDEMETVIRFEIQQYLPINLDDCVLQTTIINEMKDLDGRQKYNVRVIAYPKKSVLEYHKLLTELNLKPYALDVNFNALNKFVNITKIAGENEDDVKKSAAFFDIGASFIDVNIYKKGKLDFTRTIKAGINDVDEILIEDGAFEKEQLKEIIETRVNFTDDDLQMSFETRLVKSVIDEWLDKLEMILQFYRNSNLENEINKIFILGGGSNLKGLSDYMSLRLGMKVELVRKVNNIAFNQRENKEDTVCDFMNVIGSIIRL